MGYHARERPIDLIRVLEAMSGDMEGEVEPVFIVWRHTGQDALRLRLRQTERTIHATYTVLDERLDHEDVVAIFKATYLDEFTQHYYRGKVDRIQLDPEGGEATEPFAYPG